MPVTPNRGVGIPVVRTATIVPTSEGETTVGEAPAAGAGGSPQIALGVAGDAVGEEAGEAGIPGGAVTVDDEGWAILPL